MEYRKAISTFDLKKMKTEGEKIAMVTAYDYPSALLADQAGADVILVGDSLGMVVLGYDSTVPVTMDDMVHHSKAVARAAKRCFVVTDMPFLSYHGSLDRTLANAARLMQEGGAKAVKMEGGREIADSVKACVNAGIPVMGHIGLTPQAVHQLGGFKLQGRQPEQARKLIDDALALEQAGVFGIVLEMVPEELAGLITERLQVPTIGIGAGRLCDGQVLVYHDMLQYASPLKPKFVKAYANVGEPIVAGISAYVREVKEGAFPGEDNVYHMDGSALEEISGLYAGAKRGE
jgi:3-methyl-2-oxobutanoate hydroxymethyltransferase